MLGTGSCRLEKCSRLGLRGFEACGLHLYPLLVDDPCSVRCASLPYAWMVPGKNEVSLEQDGEDRGRPFCTGCLKANYLRITALAIEIVLAAAGLK